MAKNATSSQPPRRLLRRLGIGAAAGLGVVWLRRQIKRKVLTRLALFPRVIGERTPQEIGLAFEEVWFASRDGLKLHGWFIPGREGGTAPKNVTVIMGHGHAGNKEPDLEYARFFQQAGYNVFMFDFRGHGRSEGPRGSSMGYWERLDVHGAVDYLLGRGQERFAVFGISMGASILIMAAAENPYIRAVIADSAYAHLHRSIAAEINNLYRAPMWLARLLAQYAWNIFAGHHRFPTKSTSPADYIAQIAPRPVLLIHGDQDKITRIENAYILHKMAKQPKEMWIQPGVPHAAGYTSYGPAYERRVLDFLSRVDWEAEPELKAPERTLDGIATLK